MRIRDLVSFTAFAATIVSAVVYITFLGVRFSLPSDRTDVSMTVADINSLVVDSNVMLRGVPVGKITKIRSSLSGATIDFYFDSRFRIPMNSEVRLENLSALGESYIELMPQGGNGPILHSGDRIATESIRQPPSISELATSVGRVLNQLDPGELERIVAEADTALPAPNTVLPNISRASKLLRNAAADMNGRGRLLLDNFQTLLENAGFVGPVLADLKQPVFSTLRNAQLVFSDFPMLIHYGAPQTMKDLSKFITRIQRLLDYNGGDLKVIGETFGPHLKAIAGALLNFDSGQILSNVLASLPEDGAVTLHVKAP